MLKEMCYVPMPCNGVQFSKIACIIADLCYTSAITATRATVIMITTTYRTIPTTSPMMFSVLAVREALRASSYSPASYALEVCV